MNLKIRKVPLQQEKDLTTKTNNGDAKHENNNSDDYEEVYENIQQKESDSS